MICHVISLSWLYLDLIFTKQFCYNLCRTNIFLLKRVVSKFVPKNGISNMIYPGEVVFLREVRLRNYVREGWWGTGAGRIWNDKRRIGYHPDRIPVHRVFLLSYEIRQYFPGIFPRYGKFLFLLRFANFFGIEVAVLLLCYGLEAGTAKSHASDVCFVLKINVCSRIVCHGMLKIKRHNDPDKIMS